MSWIITGREAGPADPYTANFTPPTAPFPDI